MKKLLILTTISATLLLLSCEKTYYLNIPTDLYQWGFYKEGSYWIYQKTGTNETDSVYVASTSTKTDTVISDKIVYRIIQHAYVSLWNANKNHSYQIKLDSHSLGMVEYDSINRHKIEYSLIDLNSENKPKDHPPYHTFIEQFETFSLNKIGYFNVIHIKSQGSNTYSSGQPIVDGTSNEYWLTKNNWIIKKITTSRYGTEEWTLLRSKIIQ